MRRRRDLLFLWIIEEPSQPIILAGASKVDAFNGFFFSDHVYREPSSTCRSRTCGSVKEWEVYQRPNDAVKGRSELNVEYDYVSLLR